MRPRPDTSVAAAQGRENPYLRTAFSQAWPQLPLLLLGSASVSVAVVVSLLASSVAPPVGWAASVVTVAPCLMALVWCGCVIVTGGEVSMRHYVGALRRLYWRAVRVAAVPLVLAVLTMIAVFGHQRDGGVWLLLPAAVGGTSTVLASVAAVVMLALRACHAEPEGPQAWLLALHLFARKPVPFLGASALGLLGVWASLNYSNGLFLLVPAPFALVLAAAFYTAPIDEVLPEKWTPRLP